MRTIAGGWQAARTPPDAHLAPPPDGQVDWLPARVPGTAAAVLRDAGEWAPGRPSTLDDEDWWFRTRFAPGDPDDTVLCLDGVATVHEVFLNGERIAAGESMFAGHRIDVAGRLRADNELAIRCRALTPLLAAPRRPRARWRTAVVAAGNLRWYRTSVLGRAPGFAPGPAPVGPWRPVALRAPADELDVTLRPRLEDGDGVLEVRMRAAGAGEAEVEVAGASERLVPDGEMLRATVVVPGVAPWWPHTHGAPELHDVVVRIDGRPRLTRRLGFRRIDAGPPVGHDPLEDGLDLHVNGVRVFARGVVWTPVDPVGLTADRAALRAALEALRDAGMNIVRLPGTGVYESAAFHDLCDELGVLVWQDLMFANMDYPVTDPSFRALVCEEVRELARTVGGRASLAVVCGNSEIEQQVAMLGLDPALGRGELFGELVPSLLDEHDVEVPYVPSAPSGGTLPFRTHRGVANYFGVGGYRRGFDDVRRAGVRFASECLALANIPDAAVAVALSGVPKDRGADWDFADVRDHYLGVVFGPDALALRDTDPERYLAFSAAVSGEVMAEVFGEWRRAASPCGGGLVLWSRDLEPGAGWGLFDWRGAPKAALGPLRRVLAPVAVWTTDEGLDGIAVHVANDTSRPLAAELRIALYRDAEVPVGEGVLALELEPHTVVEHDAEAILGHFADVSWAYRFGPPQHDVLVASLEADGRLVSQAFRFPVGRSLQLASAAELGLTARADGGGLELCSRRVVHGVRVQRGEMPAADDVFALEPGRPRRVVHPGAGPWRVSALNLDDALEIPAP